MISKYKLKMPWIYKLNATGVPERKQRPIDGLVEPGERIVSFIDAAQSGLELKHSELPPGCLLWTGRGSGAFWLNGIISC